MKTKPFLLTALIIAFIAAQAKAAIIGYVNQPFQPGDNWFGNPLLNVDNSLTSLFPSPPNGTSISLWNPTSSTWTPSANFTAGSGWDHNLDLPPGTGARLVAPSAFTNTFVGTVLNFDGTPLTLNGNYTPPPPFAGPSGSYLLASQLPHTLPGLGFDVFLAIVGREPRNGEQFTGLDPLTQTYTTTTFLGGVWDNGDPSLAVGQAAMFNLIAVAEPSSIALLAVGVCTLRLVRQRICWRP